MVILSIGFPKCGGCAGAVEARSLRLTLQEKTQIGMARSWAMHPSHIHTIQQSIVLRIPISVWSLQKLVC